MQATVDGVQDCKQSVVDEEMFSSLIFLNVVLEYFQMFNNISFQ